MQPLRKAEVYGDVKLSVQASYGHYSTPRVDGLDLDDYSEVEVAVIGPKKKIVHTLTDLPEFESDLCKPSEVGVYGFDHLFESGQCPVAPYVPKAVVECLRQALLIRAEQNEKKRIRTLEDDFRIAAEEVLHDAGANEIEAETLAAEVVDALLMDYSESLSSAAARHLKEYRKRRDAA